MSERTPLQAVPGLARPADIPGPPPRKTPPISAGEPKPTTAGEQPATREPRPPRKPRVSESADVARVVAFSLPASLVEGFREGATRRKTTQAEFLMDALNATVGRLPELLQQDQPAPVRDGLFVRQAPRPRSEPHGIVSVRLLVRNIEAIDNLVAELDAPSRSALVAVAVKAHLASLS